MPGSSAIAATSRAPTANDPARKNAHAPSPTTRQSSRPGVSWNRFGLMGSVFSAT
jgi:hypothetical protein